MDFAGEGAEQNAHAILYSAKAEGALDMAFMVLTYHHLAKPVDLLKNLIPSLKPGAEIVIIDPDPVRDEDR